MRGSRSMFNSILKRDAQRADVLDIGYSLPILEADSRLVLGQRKAAS